MVAICRSSNDCRLQDCRRVHRAAWGWGGICDAPLLRSLTRVCGCRFVYVCTARAVSSAPRFVERLQNQSVREGEPVLFSVEAVGVPVPMIGWSKDGRMLPGPGAAGDDRYRVETDGGRSSLHIAAARPDDNAWFQCTAASVAGTATNRARLVVQGKAPVPPPTWASNPPPSDVVYQRRGVLLCGSRCGPQGRLS